MESKNGQHNKNFNKNEKQIHDIKLEKFYQIYKSKILDSEQEKTLNNFKERISKLNELEIKIARLEKFEKISQENLKNYKEYINTAKEVY
jgi:hypothetical protein